MLEMCEDPYFIQVQIPLDVDRSPSPDLPECGRVVVEELAWACRSFDQGRVENLN